MENTRDLFQMMSRRFGLLNKNCCSADGLDISLIQSHILYEINRQHTPSVQEVAEALGTDITTFSRQVQSLIRMNLVNKTPSLNDRRIHTLELTMEGTKVAEIIDEQINTYLEEIFAHMTDFEKETVIRSIQLLNNAMGEIGYCCAPAPR
ncbi:MarR family winged helix-turn-helix transcriptional regulator [Oceanobacillus sp. FSL W7-1293]|uniref:MarR family winged helix-turn-helix transcriptional regulator n=1 Tax=Oceanobacillus sp. FSL W7-1293 TaxID=2921699 RepID=UPI0030CC1311